MAASPATPELQPQALRSVPQLRTFRLLQKETLVRGDGKRVLPVTRFTFEIPSDETVGLNVGCGAHIKVFAPRAPEPKSYSITSSPARLGSFDITVKHYPGGKVSGYIHSLLEGHTVEMSVPLPPPRLRKRRLPGRFVCMIVQGIGITEGLRVATAELEDDSVERVTLLYANRYAEEVVFRTHLEVLGIRHGSRFRLVAIFSQDNVHGALHGRVNSKTIFNVFQLGKYADMFEETRFHVVGNKQFIHDMWSCLHRLGYHQHQHALLLKTTQDRRLHTKNYTEAIH